MLIQKWLRERKTRRVSAARQRGTKPPGQIYSAAITSFSASPNVPNLACSSFQLAAGCLVLLMRPGVVLSLRCSLPFESIMTGAGCDSSRAVSHLEPQACSQIFSRSMALFIWNKPIPRPEPFQPEGPTDPALFSTLGASFGRQLSR